MHTSETIHVTEMAISQSQKNVIGYIKNDMIATYRHCCDIPNYEITCNLFFIVEYH